MSVLKTAPEEKNDISKFTIYRGAEAPTIMEAQCMDVLPFTEIQAKGLRDMHTQGPERGETGQVLFNAPGFSLVYAWFKSNYPLPLHSHNADCLYYIISGSLKLGTEELGPRDGFFIPADVPYTYTPGPQGVEVLEFRQAQHFDFKLLAKGEAFWKRAVETAGAMQDTWKDAGRPVLNA